MLKNYFVIGYRNLLRNKTFSLINISGLAIGMAACFLIMQYVLFEWSYDSFHKNKDRIYRVTIEDINQGSTSLISTNHPGTGPALKLDYPEVQEFARLLHQSIFMGQTATWSATDERGNQKVFNENRIYCADPSFLRMFDFPFLYGDPASALEDPTAVVISESESRKFFGSENPLGKTMVLDGWKAFTVTGVFRDIPENSHIHFDMLVSYFFTEHPWKASELKVEGNWHWAEFFTYIQLAPHADPKKLESKFDDFVTRYAGEYLKRMSSKQRFHLQPLSDIHLRSTELTKEREAHGSKRSVYFLLIIAALILMIAWINYINLSTSKSVERAREVGVRKVAGASRYALITQFLLESILTNLLAMIVAFMLIAVCLPYFNQLTGKNIETSIFKLTLFHEPLFWMALATIFLAGSFLSGLYPAFVLSSFRPVSAIKGKIFGSRSGAILRKVLVASQFSISVALIAGTMMVYRQLTFMRSQTPGYAMNQLLVFKAPRVGDSTMLNRILSFRSEVTRNPNIKGVAFTSDIPGRALDQMNLLRRYEDKREDQVLYYIFFASPDFITTYGLHLLAGRNVIDGEHIPWTPEDKSVVPLVMTEKAIHMLRYDSPEKALNQLVYYGLGDRDWVGKIVGVVENYHQRSLREGYDAIVILPVLAAMGDYVTINMRMDNPSATIQFVGDQFRRIFPGNSFDYFFLDDFVNGQYAADQKFGNVFGLFSGLALLVAGLGLFGLSTFMITQRTKEIAIRKVLGASIKQMITMFSSDFIKLIVIANAIALPVAYWLVSGWLNCFAFHTTIGWFMFVAPASVLVVITLGTIIVQTTRTGFVNPAEALKVE